jgi:hypothetical protein
MIRVTILAGLITSTSYEYLPGIISAVVFEDKDNVKNPTFAETLKAISVFDEYERRICAEPVNADKSIVSPVLAVTQKVTVKSEP